MPYWWWYLGLFLFSLSLVLRIQDYFNKNSEAGGEDKEMKERVVYLECRSYTRIYSHCTYHFHTEKPRIPYNADYRSYIKKYVLKEEDLNKYKTHISSYNGLDSLAKELYKDVSFKEHDEEGRRTKVEAFNTLKNLFKD
jgi:hypothetical protein